tara:strand:- start:219 stop:473 length:255 start_codon:yes stop_codon:yes gene_type:complete
MNINPDYKNQHIPSSSEVMEGVQHIIYNMLIEPMQGKLSLEDLEFLGSVGEQLQGIAKKASLWEGVLRIAKRSSGTPTPKEFLN